VHLRSLRLRGFKSFPDMVEITLEPGVAVVVGPNGSGKSNVADAIVWAAGSLTPSELRAEKPDDVLFAGGGERKAAEHCEVELVFDAEGGSFGDLPYAEVSIARRLVRGGEGQYLVNRAPVRRTDLVELLADVGLGGSMHSIVSQGKVEEVLASRSSERRELIEEAAGLGKFKRRRHRAELKLARVATQVERARDVEEEVRKRLRPLALQATAAERAEKLADEVARLRARIAQLDLEAASARRTEAEERKLAAGLARRGAQERLQALLAERQQAEDELADAAGRREEALKALYRLQAAAERIALRRESAGALAGRLEEELAEAERAATERTDDAVRELEELAAGAAATARDAAAVSGAAAERARMAQERLAALERAAAGSAETRLQELRAEREAVEAELAGAAAERAGSALYRLGAVRERLAARHEATGRLLAVLHEELAGAQAVARRPGPSPAELEAAANEAAAVARAAARERDELAERALGARDRLAALERSLAEREGIPPAARALAEDGERLALSVLEVEPGTERAVAAALGSRASAVLADDAGGGLSLLRRAMDSGLGSLTVLVDRDPAELVAAIPVVPLADLLAAQAPAVTEEGFGYDPQRGELWFAGETAEAVLLELEARRRALATEASDLEAQAKSAAAAASAAAEGAATAETAYAEVAHLRDARAADPVLLARFAGCAERLDETLSFAAAAAARLEAPLRERAESGSARSALLGTELRRLGSEESEAARELADARARASRADVLRARLGGGTGEAVAADPGADRETLEREAGNLLAEAERAAAVAEEASERARAAGAALVERAPRRARLDADLLRRLQSGAERLGDALGGAAGICARLEAPLRARVDAGASRAGDLGGELRRLGAAEVGLRQAVEEAAQRTTEIEVELTRIEAEAAEAERRLAGAGAEPAEGADREELAARAERLERRRIELGQVNPLAKEEYEREKERLEELATQRRDVEASLAELEKLRAELAETVERRFAETYAAVEAHFEEVAATLFPGGEGRLRLVEADEEGEEAGVEVELRPAGKKITRLSLLSGGEKALGAIAFLFALFLARPCPFYLLDEVEAALDDANISRFVELLRRYADRAQFIVITHQKRTMEAADTLYGVTMGADGVSQVVSRRLPREREHALASTA